MIETLVRTYQDHLSLQYSQQRLFPLFKFNFTGKIIGWKFASFNSMGRGRPNISVWSPLNMAYVTSDYDLIDECFSSVITLDDNREVFIIESGPTPPGISFMPGDFLGLFMRPQEVADFVVYMYDGSRQSVINKTTDYFSCSIAAQGAGRTSVDLNDISDKDRDQLLPLLSLHLCEG